MSRGFNAGNIQDRYQTQGDRQPDQDDAGKRDSLSNCHCFHASTVSKHSISRVVSTSLMSSRIFTLSLTFAMPRIYLVSTFAPKSGVSSMSDEVSVSTSETSSTTIPISKEPEAPWSWTTKMNVRW